MSTWRNTVSATLFAKVAFVVFTKEGNCSPARGFLETVRLGIIPCFTRKKAMFECREGGGLQGFRAQALAFHMGFVKR